MTDKTIGWWQRLWLAVAVFAKLLCDATLARRVAPLLSAERGQGLAPGAQGVAPATIPVASALAAQGGEPEQGALLLLSLLQSEGRLVDFVQQPLEGFSDAEIAAVARLVHGGCAKVLREHIALEPVRSEPEGENVELESGFDAASIKLTGSVTSALQVKGVLRHKGWRARSMTLPVSAPNPLRVVCPAEVEV